MMASQAAAHCARLAHTAIYGTISSRAALSNACRHSPMRHNISFCGHGAGTDIWACLSARQHDAITRCAGQQRHASNIFAACASRSRVERGINNGVVAAVRRARRIGHAALDGGTRVNEKRIALRTAPRHVLIAGSPSVTRWRLRINSHFPLCLGTWFLRGDGRLVAQDAFVNTNSACTAALLLTPRCLRVSRLRCALVTHGYLPACHRGGFPVPPAARRLSRLVAKTQ